MATSLPGGGRLVLDYAALGRVLKSPEVRAAVVDAAERAASIYSGPGSIEVRTYTTDRAVAGITVTGPNPIGDELVNGSLSSAARAAGLEVRS